MDILLPPSGTGPGVLVAHPWWGLNQTIRDYGARLVSEGFVVGLVDAFDGEVTTEIAKAEEFLGRFRESAGPRVKDAIKELAAHSAVTGDGVGAIGFSFGGFQLLKALDDASLPLARLVIYYAVYPLPDRHVPVLAHFAGKDDFETDEDMAEMAKALEQAGAPNASFSYPGTAHWFAEIDRPEYDMDAANLAFERTVGFLRRS
jgi:carboxymethylenebutenolidase